MRPILLFTLVAFLAGCNEKSSEKTWYLFSYFSGIQTDSTGNGQDGLHLAYSEDALVWQELNGGRSVLKPQVGADKLMRDPCVHQGPDGTFHMVWTVSWEAPMIGYASSSDLINWSEQQEIVPFPDEPKARNCWAPEITYDPDNQEFMIYWSTTIPGKFPETDSSNIKGRNHRIYYTTTSDFSNYSPTKLLYDPGFNSIDASIYQDENRWVMFIKDETRYPEVRKNIKIAYSDRLTNIGWRDPQLLKKIICGICTMMHILPTRTTISK